VKFFVDECLSRALARRLNEHGFDAFHPLDDGRPRFTSIQRLRARAYQVTCSRTPSSNSPERISMPAERRHLAVRRRSGGVSLKQVQSRCLCSFEKCRFATLQEGDIIDALGGQEAART
jgi:hypothetical protein